MNVEMIDYHHIHVSVEEHEIDILDIYQAELSYNLHYQLNWWIIC